MNDSTASQMPMGQAAAKLSTPPPLPLPPAMGAPLPLPPPPASAMPAPTQAAPTPQAAPAIPWQVKQQPDGTSVDYIPSPDGNSANDIIIGVNKAPKLPRALQPQAPAPRQ